MNANRGPDFNVLKLLEDQYKLKENDILKKFIAPLTALRRLTFIYGFMKLYQTIHKLPEITLNVEELKTSNPKECNRLLSHLRSEANKLKDIVVKLMLFHSEYMDVKKDVKEVTKTPQSKDPQPVEHVKDKKQEIPKIQKTKVPNESIKVDDSPENTVFIPLLRIIYIFFSILLKKMNEISKLIDNETTKKDDDDEIEEVISTKQKQKPTTKPNPINQVKDKIKEILSTSYSQGGPIYSLNNISVVFDNISGYNEGYSLIQNPDNLKDTINGYKKSLSFVQNISKLQQIDLHVLEEHLQTTKNLLSVIKASFDQEYWNTTLNWDAIISNLQLNHI